MSDPVQNGFEHDDDLTGNKSPCVNLSLKFQQYLYRLLIKSNVTTQDLLHVGDLGTNETGTRAAYDHGRSDSEAVVYIIVVLCFYSFGIVFMMFKYLQHEEKELEEFEIYKNYLKTSKDNTYQMYNRRGRISNRLALQALNTVNAIPQTNQLSSKVTFV
ncbi:Uncharacterised protein g4479 [Pycnogonum litorale]